MLRLIVASVAAVVCTDTSPYEDLRQLISKSTAGSANDKKDMNEAVTAFEAYYVAVVGRHEEAVNSLKVELFPIEKGDVFAQQVTTTRDLFTKLAEVHHTNSKTRQAFNELLNSLPPSHSEEIKPIREKLAGSKCQIDADFVKIRDFVKHVSAPKVKTTKELKHVLSGCDLIVTDMTTLAEEDERTGEDVASAKNVSKLSSDIKILLRNKLLKKENLTVPFVILGVIGALVVGGAAFYFCKMRQ